MLKPNFLLKKLRSNNPVIGTWITIPSVINVDIISSTGLDFIIIDFEHGPISFETAQQMIIAAENNKVSPIIRVSNNIQGDILRSLDIGAHGIQLPNVDNVDQLHKLVDYSKFPPIGNRGFSPYTRAGNYNNNNAYNLVMNSNHNLLTIINVESKESIMEIDSYLDNEQLDVIFIGLYDLSKSLGIPGEVDNPMMYQYLEEIVIKANKRNKYIGTIITNKDNLLRISKLGVKYLVYMVDNQMLYDSYANVVSTMRKLSNE